MARGADRLDQKKNANDLGARLRELIQADPQRDTRVLLLYIYSHFAFKLVFISGMNPTEYQSEFEKLLSQSRRSEYKN